MKQNNFIILLELMLQLPKLKELRFDMALKEQSNVNPIPFNILKRERKTRYDFRLCHTAYKLEFSEDNARSLVELNFLAITMGKDWDFSSWKMFLLMRA